MSLVCLKRHQRILVDLSQIRSFRAHVDIICHRVGVTAADCIFLLVLLKIGLEDGLGALETLLVAPLVLFSFKNITKLPVLILISLHIFLNIFQLFI